MELISNIRSFYLSWRTLLSIFSESDQLATDSEDVFIFHSFLKYLNILDLRLLVDYFWHFVYINSAILHSLQWKSVIWFPCMWSVIFLLDVFKIFSLFSFNILFLWYISIWISLLSLRIIDLGVNIVHHIYKVFNNYIFEIFKFLLLSSSPWNFDYTYVIVLNEVSHFLRLCSFYIFFSLCS